MQRSAVIGDGDGAAGEGGIAADLDGGNIIGVAGGGEGGTGYGEGAVDIDGSGGEFSGTDGDSSSIDGEVCGMLSVIGYPDGIDGKGAGAGAGAGDGEALLRGYDGGKGVGALEDQGAVGQGGIEREGRAIEVLQGDGIVFTVYGSGAAVSISNSFALL